jgi:hypothetical protein
MRCARRTASNGVKQPFGTPFSLAADGRRNLRGKKAQQKSRWAITTVEPTGRFGVESAQRLNGLCKLPGPVDFSGYEFVVRS